jgi:predicted acylesterase/phospholipase RssA
MSGTETLAVQVSHHNFFIFKKLNKNHEKKPRLIITSVDILDGTSVVFDSHKTDIDVEHILASSAYPFYGIKNMSLKHELIFR